MVFKLTPVGATFVAKQDNGVLGLNGPLVLQLLEHQFKLVPDYAHLETAKEVLQPNPDHVYFMIHNQLNHNGELGEVGVPAVPVAAVVP